MKQMVSLVCICLCNTACSVSGAEQQKVRGDYQKPTELKQLVAETTPAKQVAPIRARGENQRAQEFQQMLEKYFAAGDRLLMPLGFFAVTNHIRKTSEMERLAKNGITLIHRYDNQLPVWRIYDDIRNAVKAGVPLAVNLPREKLKNDDRWWEDYLRSFIDNKQIIIWYLPEEPGALGLPRLSELTKLLHKMDKLHRPVMTYLKSTDKSVLTNASKFMDCLVYGAFPNHGWKGGGHLRIAKRMDMAYSCGAPAVIAAQEAFKTKSGWTKPEHIMFDTYIALIHGARGLWWYGYHYARDNSRLLNAVLARTRILNGPEYLGEVFLRGEDNQDIQAWILAGPAVFPDSVNQSKRMYLRGKIYPSVHWRAYNHRGNIYLVMVNCCEMIKESNPEDDEKALTVEVEFRGFDADSKIVLVDGNSAYKCQEGALTVTLKPLGVAVFKITQ